jgi:hypothetical protein
MDQQFESELPAAICNSARRGHAAIVQMLINVSADYCRSFYRNAIYIWTSALWGAAEGGHTELARHLLAANKEDFSKEILLQAAERAAKQGHTAIIKMLVDSYPRLAAQLRDEAFRYAAQEGHMELAEYCVTGGQELSQASLLNAARTARKRGHTVIVKMLTSSYPRLAAEFAKEDLSKAVREGRTELVRHCLDFLDKEMIEKSFTLQAAVFEAACEGHAAIIQMLIDSRPDLLTQLAGAALRGAASGSHTELVRRLLDGGEISEPDLKMAVMDSAKRGNAEIVDLLIRSRPDLLAQLAVAAVRGAAGGGPIELVENYLHLVGKEIFKEDLVTAIENLAKRGADRVIERLINSCPNLSAPLRGAVLIGALEGGHMELVRSCLNLAAKEILAEDWERAIRRSVRARHDQATEMLMNAAASCSVELLRRLHVIEADVKENEL